MSSPITFTVQVDDPTYTITSTYDPFGGSVPTNGSSSGSSGSSYAYSSQGVAAIQGLYQSVLGRAADPTGLAASQSYLASGGSLGALETAMAYGAEARSHINAIYEQVLGRPVDSGGLASNQAVLAKGTTLAQLRANVANSTEATTDINAIYGSILSRTADAQGLATYRNSLATGQTLAQVRSSVAYSVEAQNDINTFYGSILGRTADQGGLATYQSQLAGGANIGSVETSLAFSAEATSDLDNVIASVQGRAPDAGDASWIAAQQEALANGSETLSQVRSNLATYSGEAGVLDTVIVNVQGRAATAADATWIQAEEQQIASGVSVAQITSSLAYYSGEVGVLDNVIQAVQGRAATSADTPWIQAQQQTLANGGSIAQITASLADYSGEAGVLDNVIQAVQGRVATSADTPWIQAQEQALASGETLAQVTSNLAYYSGETNVLDNVIQAVQGRQAGTGDMPWIQAQEGALANGSTTVAQTVNGLATYSGEANVISHAVLDVFGYTPVQTEIQTDESQLSAGNSIGSILQQGFMAASTSVAETVEQVIAAVPTQAQVNEAMTLLDQGLNSSVFVLSNLGTTLSRDTLSFLQNFDPVDTASAATTSALQAQRVAAATNALQNPNVKAFLAVIKDGESYGGDYTALYSPDGQRHDFVGTAYPGFTDLSEYSASGAYGMTQATFNNEELRTGLTDFSPQTQDIMTVDDLARMGILSTLNQPTVTEAGFQTALSRASYEWSSLPVGSPAAGLDHSRYSGTIAGYGHDYTLFRSIAAPLQ